MTAARFDEDAASAARLEAVKAIAAERATDDEPEPTPGPVGANPLTVSCDHCRAPAGQHCVIPGSAQRLTKTPYHPTRTDKAAAAAEAATR